MDPFPNLQVLVANVEEALLHAQSIEECQRTRELATVAQRYAQGKETPFEVLQKISCLMIEAEHALGEAILKTGLPKGTLGNQHSQKKVDPSIKTTGPKSLRDLKISRDLSSRAQLIAQLSRDELRRWLADQCQQGLRPTIRAVKQHAKSLSQPPAPHIPIDSNLDEPLRPMTRADAQTELLDIQKTLDRLLRRMYDGGNVRVTQAQGRLMKQRVKEIGQVARDLGPMEPKKD